MYADSQGSKVCKGEIPCTVQTFQSGHIALYNGGGVGWGRGTQSFL